MTNDFISFSGFGLRPSFVIAHSGFVIFSSHPITLRFPADEALVVPRIAKSDVVPAGAGPLRHHVRFACGFVGITNPILRFRQWWLARPGWFVVFQRRRHYRQLGFGQRSMLATFPHDGERFAPVTLPGKEPIPKFVID